jgi:hypothetical protein
VSMDQVPLLRLHADSWCLGRGREIAEWMQKHEVPGQGMGGRLNRAEGGRARQMCRDRGRWKEPSQTWRVCVSTGDCLTMHFGPFESV